VVKIIISTGIVLAIDTGRDFSDIFSLAAKENFAWWRWLPAKAGQKAYFFPFALPELFPEPL